MGGLPFVRLKLNQKGSKDMSEREENDFNSTFDNAFKEKSPNFDAHLNIAIVGKVSTGKSSLLNAILGREQSNPLADVGAEAGVTKEVTSFRLGDQVLIIDTPGLADIRAENSEVTQEFLNNIDLGIFVVTDSADVSQKENYLDLKKHAKKVIVVLNKIDIWDRLEENAYLAVKDQWKKALDVDQIYGTCTFGYDKKARKDIPLDIRGVDELRDEIFKFLDNEGKAILLARQMAKKDKYAIGIITTALAAVAAEAFIPGSAAYITATQLVAITSLYYLHTGKVMSKSSALSLLPAFVGQSLGTNLFLWAKSLLPPTGVVDIAAAGIAVLITFAMLAAVHVVLKNGDELASNDVLKEAYSRFYSMGKDLKWDDIKNSQRLTDTITRFLNK
jgi:small GTP-binding protein